MVNFFTFLLLTVTFHYVHFVILAQTNVKKR